MNLPPRETLLDVDWLTRTHAVEGFKALWSYARIGAEAYGGPVTGLAEAVGRLGWTSAGTSKWLDTADIRHGLAHTLASGSWSNEPDGPRAAGPCWEWFILPDKRPKRIAEGHSCTPPSLPDLRGLHLVDPLDCAWIGHTAGIWGCAVSPNGRCMVSASRDGDVSLWDMESGTLIARARTEKREIRDCIVTSDGRHVISVHQGGRITIYDVTTMAVIVAFDAPPSRPTNRVEARRYHDEMHASPSRWRRIAVSSDGSRLAVAGWNSIDVWSLERFGHLTTIRVDPGLGLGIMALAFSSGNTLVTIGRSNPAPILTWDLATARIVVRRTLVMPRAGHIARAIVTCDSQLVVAADPDETTVWQLDTPAAVAKVPFGLSGQALAVSLDGTLAATFGGGPADTADEKLRLWSLPDLRELQSWSLRDFGCRDISCALAFAPDGRRLVIAGWEGVLRRVILPFD
jgi:WD40 repeat protein